MATALFAQLPHGEIFQRASQVNSRGPVKAESGSRRNKVILTESCHGYH